MDSCKKIIIIFILIFFLFLFNKCFALTFTYNGNEYTCKDPPVVNKPYQVVALQYRKDTNVWYKSFYYCDYPIGIYHNGSEWGYAVGDYNTNHTQGTYYYNTSGLNSSYGSTTYNFITGTFYPVTSTKYQEPVFYANYELRLFNNYTDIENNYSGSNSSVIVPLPENYDNLPYFLNDSTDIAYGGYNIVVMPGDFPNSKEIVFTLEENNPTEVGAGGIQDVWTTQFSLSLTAESQFYYAIDNTGVGFYYVIPWNFIMRYLTLTKEYRYSLSYTINGDPEGTSLVVTYGGTSTDDAIYNAGIQQTIQQQETTQAIQDQTQAIEDQTQAIEDINSTITDDTITSSASDLPSINVTDPSQNGIGNTIFCA